MDQSQSRALEALQPFIHLTTSSTASSPRFVANIITNATSNPNTFVFAELLETPAVQALGSPDTPEPFRGYLKLLEIFAWGTWQEYQDTANLPALSKEQTLKLRLLSLLSLASTLRPLTYQSLMKALSIPTAAELESLVTTAIYSSLITARLSPATNPPLVHVSSVAPLRDVRPQTVSGMISILSEWEGRCGNVIGGIEAEIAKIKAQAAKNRERERERASRRERSIAGWNGDGAEDSGGADRGPASKNLRKPPAGRKLGGGSGGVSNKREFRGDDDDDDDDDGVDEDDGYFDNASDGGVDASGGRMDIDEGAGAGIGGSGRSGGIATRQAKRVLGVGRKT